MKRPEPTSRHPLIVFLMLLCIMTGLRILLGSSAPSTIEAELQPWQVRLWGIGCGGGALLFLVGIHLQPFDGAPQVRTGIILEQLGAAVLGAACTIYAVCIVEATGFTSILLAGIVAVFAAACFLRWWTIQKHVNRQGVPADGSL